MTSRFDGMASLYDLGMFPLELLVLARLRRRIYPYLDGRVLELGVGTGVNLPLYKAPASVVATDASAAMVSRARRRRMRARASFLSADATHLPFGPGLFDFVTGSLLFCSVDDPAAALAEVRRVLRPGGWLYLLEHVRGAGQLRGRVTDLLDAPWHRFSQSCHLNRDTEALVRDAGFRMVCAPRFALGFVQIIVAR